MRFMAFRARRDVLLNPAVVGDILVGVNFFPALGHGEFLCAAGKSLEKTMALQAEIPVRGSSRRSVRPWLGFRSPGNRLSRYSQQKECRSQYEARNHIVHAVFTTLDRRMIGASPSPLPRSRKRAGVRGLTSEQKPPRICDSGTQHHSDIARPSFRPVESGQAPAGIQKSPQQILPGLTGMAALEFHRFFLSRRRQWNPARHTCYAGDSAAAFSPAIRPRIMPRFMPTNSIPPTVSPPP